MRPRQQRSNFLKSESMSKQQRVKPMPQTWNTRSCVIYLQNHVCNLQTACAKKCLNRMSKGTALMWKGKRHTSAGQLTHQHTMPSGARPEEEEEWPLHNLQPKNMHAPKPPKGHITHNHHPTHSTTPHNSHRANKMPPCSTVHSSNTRRKRNNPKPLLDQGFSPPTTAELPKTSSDPASRQGLG